MRLGPIIGSLLGSFGGRAIGGALGGNTGRMIGSLAGSLLGSSASGSMGGMLSGLFGGNNGNQNNHGNQSNHGNQGNRGQSAPQQAAFSSQQNQSSGQSLQPYPGARRQNPMGALTKPNSTPSLTAWAKSDRKSRHSCAANLLDPWIWPGSWPACPRVWSRRSTPFPSSLLMPLAVPKLPT
jgi:hypothetical protein